MALDLYWTEPPPPNPQPPISNFQPLATVDHLSHYRTSLPPPLHSQYYVIHPAELQPMVCLFVCSLFISRDFGTGEIAMISSPAAAAAKQVQRKWNMGVATEDYLQQWPQRYVLCTATNPCNEKPGPTPSNFGTAIVLSMAAKQSR